MTRDPHLHHHTNTMGVNSELAAIDANEYEWSKVYSPNDLPMYEMEMATWMAGVCKMYEVLRNM